MGFFDNIREPVPIDALSALPARRRAAWAAHCIGQVVPLLSKHYRTTYRQDEFLELAWRWACQEIDAADFPDDLLGIYESLYDLAEDEGYGGVSVDPAMFLLAGIQGDSALRISRAIDSAAWLFSARQVWVQGVRPCPQLPAGHIEGYERRFFRMARSAFEFAMRTSGPVTRDLFVSEDSLDGSYAPLPLEIINRINVRPPSHEVGR